MVPSYSNLLPLTQFGSSQIKSGQVKSSLDNQVMLWQVKSSWERLIQTGQVRNCFEHKIFLDPNYLWNQIFFLPNIFLSKIFLDPNYLWNQIFFYPIFIYPKFCLTQHNFLRTFFIYSISFLIQNLFWLKVFCTEHFLIWRLPLSLIVLVDWWWLARPLVLLYLFSTPTFIFTKLWSKLKQQS